MKPNSKLRQYLRSALWLIGCVALVWHFRSYVGVGIAQIMRGRQLEQTAQSRKNLRTDDPFTVGLVDAALARPRRPVRYDGIYLPIGYPGGDVPPEIGVCTDEVIRSYRAVGIDLQQLVHEDMKKAFGAYPKIWGLAQPDPNIDHRRVPNLQVFLDRQGAALPISNRLEDYQPGDLITCNVRPDAPHIALVVPAPDGGSRPWVVHNIGRGPQIEDRLFDFPLTGHYRWHPVVAPVSAAKGG